MALVVDAFDVVVRVEALPDGVKAFARTVPNATFCTDGVIARASFMNVSDREHFGRRLAGLAPESLACVDRARGLDAETTWLAFGPYAGVMAVWVAGVSPGPLVVPISWRPDANAHYTQEEAEKYLEYVGTEQGVEVYRDKRTGKKLYTARTRPSVDPEVAAKLEALRKETANEVMPLVVPPRKLGFFETRKVKRAITQFERVLVTLPDDWSTLWFVGMCRRAVARHTEALDAFRRAYAENPGQPDVGREYAIQCMMGGEGHEAVRVAREGHARFPQDAGLQANLGLALLIGGDLDEALAVVESAHERQPDDAITANVLRLVRNVKAGRSPRPTKIP
ncbi:tetratricopeptide repeat protein [Pendulispora rubella]|uniref:Tetratricopeptide repeat protein n=1 Tax=Pendulispora rubella TaxID=2741070 RepID=A0ABZ2KQB3_9BACT